MEFKYIFSRPSKFDISGHILADSGRVWIHSVRLETQTIFTLYNTQLCNCLFYAIFWLISCTKMYLEQCSAVTVGQNIGFNENIWFETRFNVKIQEKFVSKKSKSSVLPDFWINIDSCIAGKRDRFRIFQTQKFSNFQKWRLPQKNDKGIKNIKLWNEAIIEL